jgi:bacterioferritin-associated ferredoxin
MLVCHCNGVSDRHIRRVVREGAVTTAQIAQATGAGACCGGCREAIDEIVHSELAEGQSGERLVLQTSSAH